MSADPEKTRRWNPEPSENFVFPADPEVALLADFCRQRYARTLCADDLKWLAGFVSDYFAWSKDRPHRNELRLAALRVLKLLVEIDSAMSNSKDPERTWREISLGLGLPSVCFSHLTPRELASSRGLTTMAVQKQVAKFLRVVELAPAFDRFGNHHLQF